MSETHYEALILYLRMIDHSILNPIFLSSTLESVMHVLSSVLDLC
jgi:hypothetical protein